MYRINETFKSFEEEGKVLIRVSDIRRAVRSYEAKDTILETDHGEYGGIVESPEEIYKLMLDKPQES